MKLKINSKLFFQSYTSSLITINGTVTQNCVCEQRKKKVSRNVNAANRLSHNNETHVDSIRHLVFFSSIHTVYICICQTIKTFKYVVDI